MKRFWIALLLLSLSACGESEVNKEARLRAERMAERKRLRNELQEIALAKKAAADKKARATSQVNMLLDKLKRRVGEDGWFIRLEAGSQDPDPWGNALRIVYDRADGQETLCVSSHGVDGLPLTSDDITAKAILSNKAYLDALAAAKRDGITDLVEARSRALSRGLLRGVLGIGRKP